MENQKKTNRTDAELIAAIQSGNMEAFEQLYQMHSTILYYNLSEICKDGNTAELVMHQLFVKLWEKRMELDPKKQLRPYLFRTARRMAMTMMRESRLAKLSHNMDRIAQELCGYPLEDKVSPDEEIILMDAINKLPKQLRVVFKLCRLEGRPDREVSKLMGISLESLDNQIAKAIETLRMLVAKRSGGLICFLFIPTLYESIYRYMLQII